MSHLLWVPALLLLSGCTGGQDHSPVDEGTPVMQVTSTAFKDNETIPKEYTGDGRDASPPLQWSGAPDGVKSYALICDDPDAPRGTWVHWVLCNLPADVRELPEGAGKNSPAGALQGKNDFGKIGYGGPAPPKGKPHHYFFKLYALDAALDLKEGATKADLEKAMKGRVLAHGQIVGQYGR
jgi:Raf kinase inhibitor-like YbhB/YbcL family protein